MVGLGLGGLLCRHILDAKLAAPLASISGGLHAAYSYELQNRQQRLGSLSVWWGGVGLALREGRFTSDETVQLSEERSSQSHRVRPREGHRCAMRDGTELN